MDKKLVNIGIDNNLKKYSNEIEYVFRIFMNICGYPFRLVYIDLDKKYSDQVNKLGLYYGTSPECINASIKIKYLGHDYLGASSVAPIGYAEENDIPFVKFVETGRCMQDDAGNPVFLNDIVFSSFWVLTGGQENSYYQDRYGNYHLEDTFYLKNSLNIKPLVSIYATIIKKYLLRHKDGLGFGKPQSLPYICESKKAAIALSHDVDYPEIIKWIECIRILGKKKLSGLKFLLPIINGSCNFWKFPEWVEFEKAIFAKSAFYFMGRQGSLLEYFLGRPDAFYDIKTKKFSELFTFLKDEGFEIGMHASFNAYKSKDIFLAEKISVEQASKAIIYGNRHHYWHLKPGDNQDTLKIHEKVGLLYDSSLHFEFYPGFRRGICHPFYPYDISERRQIRVLQLPPAWMDNQFDSHNKKNKIQDEIGYARKIMKIVSATEGVLTLDYHVRGMNEEFYPKYGAWLKRLLLQDDCFRDFNFITPVKIAQCWAEHAKNINPGVNFL